MKAVWYDKQGPAKAVMVFGEVPTPNAGPGEVRVKLEASGTNPSDTYRRGGGAGPMEYPRVVANSDGAGVIDQVGKGVTRFREGQRVWLYNGQRNGRAFGTAAEYIALDETLVQPLPDNVSFAEGATLGVPGMTAWVCLFHAGPITGQTILVTGGAGAIMVRSTTESLDSADPLRQILEHTRALGEKDLTLALDLGRRLGIDLPMAQYALEHFGSGLGLPTTEQT